MASYSLALCVCRATTLSLLFAHVFLAAAAATLPLLAPSSGGPEPIHTLCTARSATTSPTVTAGEFERFLRAVSTSACGAVHRAYSVSWRVDAGKNWTKHFVAQCRTDIRAADCTACLAAASARFLADGEASCAEAAVWHEHGRCFLRYSDQDTSRFREDKYAATLFNSSGRPARHGRAVVARLLAEVAGSLHKRGTKHHDDVAWGAASSYAGEVYGLAQCAPGIARDDCGRCLRGALAVTERDYNGSAGMQILRLSCMVRYESYRFYETYGSTAGTTPVTTTPISPQNGRNAFPPAAHGLPPGTAPSTRPPSAAPPEGCCPPNMVQRPGSQHCYCVYPVRVELLLLNISTNSDWAEEFLWELALQLNLRGAQFEIVNFYVTGASSLNITMDIAPGTGISFSADQVTAMNYSLSLHTLRINPRLVGDYNLLNITWFRPLAPAPAQTPTTHTMTRKTVILLIVLTASGVAVVCILLSFRAHRRRQRNKRDAVADGIPAENVYFQGEEHLDAEGDEDRESSTSGQPQPYSYKILGVATCHFSNSNKLGSGGFGTVYRGTLENGKEVAVKKLKDSERSLQELEREVSIVAMLRHENVVRFLGCCFEDKGRLLVYEYLPNNSLDKFWNKGSSQCQRLDWKAWFNIIKGVSRGLQFLHKKGIIHRDLKPYNILLDEMFNPKIADFDLVRVYNKDETHQSTEKVAGTFGYMAPECTSGRKFQFSIKSDVYSYGVLVLEIITGRKIHTFEGHNSEGLVEYVWQQWTEGKVADVVDSDLDVETVEQGWQQALRCVHVALLCVQSDRTRRPTMDEVITMLNYHQNSKLQAPSLPGYLHPKSSPAHVLRPSPCFGCN